MNDLFRNMLGTEPLHTGGSGRNPLVGTVISLREHQLSLDDLIAEGRKIRRKRNVKFEILKKCSF